MAKKSTSKKKPSVKRAPKTKKKTDFKTSEQRSVFLYGKPNKEKLAKLSKIQNDYTAASQHYVDLLADNEDFLLPLLKHDRKGHELRSLEKANRVSYLTSALSQSAFDHAVDMVANRLDNIKSYVYENAPSVLSSSKVLFAMCVQNKSKNEMISAFKDIVENIHKQDEEKLKEGKTPQQGKDKFYIDTIAELESMNDCTFNANADAVRLYYYEGTAIFRVPTIKHASVRLVSTLYTLEKSKNIEAPYVISVTDPSSRGKRIDVPLNTSRNSLRRLDQYGAKHSVDYTIRKDGLIKVTVAFEKKHITPEVKKLRGVDVGTNDALHTSDDKAFGSFDQCAKFYDEQVLPLAGVRSSILNKKRAIKHYLHTHKNLPDNVKKDLRDKMDHLEAMLRREKEYYHRLNHYQDIQRREIKTAVNDYIESLHGDRSIATALELLDIKEFDKSKKTNRKLSNFARGLLTKTLMETLNWNGFTYIQVEPAYTSQECPVCHFTLKENRNGKVFHCKCCGYHDDADHVGALNIAARVDDDEITEICKSRFGIQRHKALHELLDKRHEEWLKEHKTEAAS